MFLPPFHLIMCTFNSEGEDAAVPSKQQRKAANAKMATLKAELKALLAQPLVARGVSTRYITSGVRSIADDFVAGECARSPFFRSPSTGPLARSLTILMSYLRGAVLQITRTWSV